MSHTFLTIVLTWVMLLSYCLGQPHLRAAEGTRLTDAEVRAGWRLLFDGTTTAGWRNYKKNTIDPGWVVEDGALVRKGDRAGDIITEGQFEHFELQLQYRIAEGGNSGVMFHVTEDADAPWQSGPEVQILDNARGGDPQKSGWLYQLYRPQKPEWAVRFEQQVGFTSPDVDDATRPAGQWNQLYLRVTPAQSEVCINGVSYYYFVKGSSDWHTRVAKSKFAGYPQFGKAVKGHICLQDHGQTVGFRNIKIRELPADGAVPDPVDGTLSLKAEVAFPKVEWEGWRPVDENGRLNPPLRPIQVTHAGDGTNRVFVIDQSGMIHVLANDPSTDRAKLFLDLRPRAHQFRVDDEEGLLGFAFHPGYKKNGQCFVYYSRAHEPRMVYLSRFRVSPGDPDSVDPESEEVLLKFKQPFANHNGGPMAFGPDGYLYLALGDGGGRNDPLRAGQSRNSLLGAVLRIDVDRADDGRKYAIPADNPFVGQPGIPGEIYAYGIRNPWRISFDRQTGHLWLADVGQDLWEEIDIIQKGGNYGWSIREGSAVFGNAEGAEQVETIDPVWEYDHRVGKSITGGYVYRGSRLPELQGHYLYGDYVAGKLWALQYDESQRKVVRNMSIPWNGLVVLAFGEDEAGEPFITTISQKGEGIYRLVGAN